MADLRQLANEASAKAAVAAGKDAAKRALDDLLLSDEEKAKRSQAEAESAKRRRWKYVAIGVVGLCLLVGLVGLVFSYWQWFLLAGLLGAAGYYGYRRLRRRLSADGSAKKGASEDADAPEAVASSTESKKARAPAPVADKVRVVDAPSSADPAAARTSLEEARRRTAELRAAREQREAAEAEAIDEELAAMKARLKK